MTALPILIFTACLFTIGYRYYSAFLAAKVFALDPARSVPSRTLRDNQNYFPMSKWVLFGHHFAAISGAGPAHVRFAVRIGRNGSLVTTVKVAGRGPPAPGVHVIANDVEPPPDASVVMSRPLATLHGLSLTQPWLVNR